MGPKATRIVCIIQQTFGQIKDIFSLPFLLFLLCVCVCDFDLLYCEAGFPYYVVLASPNFTESYLCLPPKYWDERCLLSLALEPSLRYRFSRWWHKPLISASWWHVDLSLTPGRSTEWVPEKPGPLQRETLSERKKRYNSPGSML